MGKRQPTFVLATVWGILLYAGCCEAAIHNLEPTNPDRVRRADNQSQHIEESDLQVGAVGVLWHHFFDQGHLISGAANMKVLSVADEENLLVKFYGHDLWLRGFAAKDVVTDDTVSTTGYLVRVTGTKTYSAVVGSNTVLMIEPYILTEAEIRADAEQTRAKAEADRKANEAAAARKAAIEKARWRVWTIAGEKIEARFNGRMNDLVLLTRRDHSRLRVLIKDLSDDDKTWIDKRK
jgi:hypothetical protein